MTEVIVPIDPALDAALSRWERHGRPGLPDSGFTLSRLPGRQRRGIYRADTGEAVIEPDGHILRMAAAPDRRHIAIQLAEHADENADLAIVDVASGQVHPYPGIRCRYEPMVWDAHSRTVDLVAREPQRLVSVDVTAQRVTTTELTAEARVRLFPAGPRGLLCESRPGTPTRMVDRATGRHFASFPAVVRVVGIGDDVLIDDGTTLHVLDPRGGTEKWSWQDPALQITSLAVAGRHVHIGAVRDGHSVLFRLADGHVIDERLVSYRGAPAVASGVSADDGRVHVLIEAPALPPRVVPALELLADTAETSSRENATVARTQWHTVTADDGENISVAITSPVDIDGPTPLILTCYGGFGVPSLPVFEPTIPAWIEHGGRYAIAHVRGGGERGRAWRDAGRGRNKHRGIDDLACVARGLVEAGYTRPDQLVLVGASHGGVLVSSCALGFPDLCAGVVSTAAPLDLLNLDAHPLGHHWINEFGDPDSPGGIDELRRISPLHRAQTLPAGIRLPRFLGVVLADDSRVNADATQAVVDALRDRGGDAAVWRADRTGHGSNHLDSLHRLGATVLSFAAITTGPARPTTSPTEERAHRT
ncbi:prolyl oligopeptidase family serine peptidase [Prauserella endophytica]|uniref:prolyl oligopeptidase n=1 Tax=Prauserella endophytica TaxID=1592324 RepID=A0ABY2S751_9PSEU|nr:prolyl oligopeptidase family serine peptidase [Prauserella endophytica]TKG71704.1 S9 family peptidase [Prauserella endophytica]